MAYFYIVFGFVSDGPIFLWYAAHTTPSIGGFAPIVARHRFREMHCISHINLTSAAIEAQTSSVAFVGLGVESEAGEKWVTIALQWLPCKIAQAQSCDEVFIKPIRCLRKAQTRKECALRIPILHPRLSVSFSPIFLHEQKDWAVRDKKKTGSSSLFSYHIAFYASISKRKYLLVLLKLISCTILPTISKSAGISPSSIQVPSISQRIRRKYSWRV